MVQLSGAYLHIGKSESCLPARYRKYAELKEKGKKFPELLTEAPPINISLGLIVQWIGGTGTSMRPMWTDILTAPFR